MASEVIKETRREFLKMSGRPYTSCCWLRFGCATAGVSAQSPL